MSNAIQQLELLRHCSVCSLADDALTGFDPPPLLLITRGPDGPANVIWFAGYHNRPRDKYRPVNAPFTVKVVNPAQALAWQPHTLVATLSEAEKILFDTDVNGALVYAPVCHRRVSGLHYGKL